MTGGATCWPGIGGGCGVGCCGGCIGIWFGCATAGAIFGCTDEVMTTRKIPFSKLYLFQKMCHHEKILGRNCKTHRYLVVCLVFEAYVVATNLVSPEFEVWTALPPDLKYTFSVHLIYQMTLNHSPRCLEFAVKT